jgi:hypothetical protein
LSKLGSGGDKSLVTPARDIANAVPVPAGLRPMAISEVDVLAKTTALASTHAEKLNKKTFIINLLKLPELDRSLTTHNQLATGLGLTR